MTRLRPSALWYDLLILAGAIAVLFLIPDVNIGPLQAFNPYKVWLIVTLLLGIGTIGQLLNRAMGTRRGLPLAGFVSGFVSSTATVMAMGLQAQKHPDRHAPAVAAAVLSGVATYIQMGLLLLALSRPLLAEMMAPLTLGALSAAIYSIYFTHRSVRQPHIEVPHIKSIITLRAALLLAGLIALISFAVTVLNFYLGEKGVWAGAAMAGLTDAHASGAAVASLYKAGSLDLFTSLVAIMLGLTSNTLLRITLAATTGSRRYALEIAPGFVLSLLAAWAGALPALL